MSPWIGVHGISNQYLGRKEILNQWIPALADGLEWATRRRHQPDLDLAFYGYLFRQTEPEQARKGSLVGDTLSDLADLDEAVERYLNCKATGKALQDFLPGGSQ